MFFLEKKIDATCNYISLIRQIPCNGVYIFVPFDGFSVFILKFFISVHVSKAW